MCPGQVNFAHESLEPRRLLAGITIVTHGFQSGGSFPQWVDRMCEAVDRRIEPSSGALWTNAALYRMQMTQSGGNVTVASFARTNGPAPASSSTGEAVIALDWASISGLSGPSTGTIAQSVVNALLGAGTGLGFGGDLVSLPMHVVGHSRGASLVAELARLLGQRGIWVDQVTTLDPYPLSGDPGPSMSANISDNVVFADNYYETTDFIVHGGPVSGAQNTGPMSLPGGSSLAHSDVHTYYHGTIARAGTSDGDVTLNTAWWTSTTNRATVGFDWSRISGAARPVGGVAPIGGGSASRVHVDPTTTTWPDVGSLSVTGGLNGRFGVGDNVSFNFRYQTQPALGEVDFYLDADTNPYNGFTRALASASALAATGAQPATLTGSTNYTWTSFELISGRYFVHALITDGSHVRFAFLPQPVFVRSDGMELINRRWSDDVANHDWTEPRNFSPGGAPTVTDRVSLDWGTVSASTALAARAIDVSGSGAITFSASQNLPSLALANSALATMTAGGGRILVLDDLNISGAASLELNDQDMILDYDSGSALAMVQGLINSARDGGAWDGAGITSTSAKNAAAANTTLGAMEAADYLNYYGAGTPFDGQTVDTSAVLVKYTYFGDTDFNGTVNLDDYANIDGGYLLNLTGWLNGDFDGSGGKPDLDDYSLIDAAFLTQGGAL
ncbi:MAG: hypothetical protein ACREJC_14955 [Tepidisphaeraceae bacterium]